MLLTYLHLSGFYPARRRQGEREEKQKAKRNGIFLDNKQSSH